MKNDYNIFIELCYEFLSYLVYSSNLATWRPVIILELKEMIQRSEADRGHFWGKKLWKLIQLWSHERKRISFGWSLSNWKETILKILGKKVVLLCLRILIWDCFFSKKLLTILLSFSNRSMINVLLLLLFSIKSIRTLRSIKTYTLF